MPENRKEGISAFARLKNAEEFLEKVVESYIDFYDEIVLVDNNSTDATPRICEQLARKYPEKIKFFHYTPEVYGL